MNYQLILKKIWERAKSNLWYIAGSLILVGIIGGVATFAYVSKDLPDPNHLSDRQVWQSTKIYDRTGQHLLYEAYQNQKRTLITLKEMSSFLPKAVVSIEDKNFYNHPGIAVKSILRAAFNDLIGRKTGGGGASTITQQLIKNTLVGNERRGLAGYLRKIKEAILALQIEKKFGKDEILQMYLNEIPLGSTNYGVEAAAQSYFVKSAKDLSLSESATLAALIQAPTRYLNNPNTLRDRRDTVLKMMFDQGYINEEQMKSAQNEALRLYKNGNLTDAPHFVLYVKQLLADQFGEKMVDEGGLKVITTLDYDKQKAAEKIVKENGDKFASSSNANNAALVSMDPKTGQILAMVGSRDFYNEDIDGQFNVAVLAKRQPGSSFKPFVYTAAFEKGYTPDTVIYDTLTNFDQRAGEKYIPKNYDGKEHGLVTIRKSLQGSLNIPAVKTLYLVGTNNAIEFAKRFGYTTFTGDPGLSLVLGGAEVNLLEHTNAYAALANNGVLQPHTSILKISDSKNNTLFEWQASSGTVAVAPEVAATISSVLTDDSARAYIFGRNSTLTLPDRAVAAKTGTTNDNKDAWTMGYTPSVVTGVWVGNTIPSPMKGGGNTLAGVIWNQFMRFATLNTPPEVFPTPPSNTSTKPVLRGADDGIVLSINKNNGKIASSSTPEALIEKRVFLPPHDILFYVNKDDPNGPAPIDPTQDPQYENWEKGLSEWIKKQDAAGKNLTLENPPTEYDDNNYNPELSPTVKINYPSNQETINGKQLDIKVDASAPRGVSQITYYIDNKQVGINNGFPFELSYTFDKVFSPAHTLKVVAIDDQGNSGQDQINFFLNTNFDPAQFDWSDGDQTSAAKEDFPKPVALKPYRWEDAKDIKIQLISPNGSVKNIYSFNPNEDQIDEKGELSFTWKNYPGAGKYVLRGTISSRGGTTETKDLTINIK
jgi:1A family penicillin-binding protein